MTHEHPEWQVVVFCRNERRRIAACLKSLLAAIGSRRGLITVIINGSTDGTETVARSASAEVDTPIQIFRIDYADKSNAIDNFLYNRGLRADAALYFFADGYITISRDALEAMAVRLVSSPHAVAASGVAANGRSEVRSNRTTVEVGGALRGQFFALKPDFVERMVNGGIHLPIGLYRGDGLLGSMAAHDLDAMGQPWTNKRVIGVPEAMFEIDSLSPFRLRDLRRQFHRKVRQMRGELEHAAVKQVIYSGGYAALPTFADDLIRDFLAANPVPPTSLLDRPFMALALQHHRAAKRPDWNSLQPHQIS